MPARRRPDAGARVAKVAIAGAAGLLAARWALRRLRRIEFRGRVALVTGGSRGLGFVMARQLLDQGARVAICARNENDLLRAEARLAGHGPVLPIVCDVADRPAVEEMAAMVTNRLGPVDILINNAGTIRVGPIETMTDEDFRSAMGVHVWGPLNTINAVLPDMRRRRFGRIVNIASIGGVISVPHLVPYSASKFALVGLSEGLRAELAPHGVGVTTVCPGLMRTGSPIRAEFKGRHRAEHAWFRVSDSLPLVSIDAETAAAKILDACRHATGRLTVSLPAKAAATGAAVAPGLAGDVLSVVNRVLPGPGGIGLAAARGFESESWLAPSPLTRLGDRAAERYNEWGEDGDG